MPHSPPVVLCLSGHDPCGGAGLQADIEAIAAQGAFAATVPTCLTEQDSRHVASLHALPRTWILGQARRVLEDYSVAAIKIGLVGSQEAADALLELLPPLAPQIPVILDPVLASGSGQTLSAVRWIQALRPFCSLITPNRREARKLAGGQPNTLLQQGWAAILVTGADEAETTVLNRLYTASGEKSWRYVKLPNQYHGSGCTLAASLAARLALGDNLETAAENAQNYTYSCLRKAFRPGQGQWIPRRL